MANNPNLDRLVKVLSQPAQQPKKPEGVEVSDYAKELASGAIQGVGYGIRGVGDIINSPRYAYGNRGSRDLLIDATPLKKAGMWIAGKGDDVAQSVSPSAQKAIAGSQPEGELLHPSTWNLGKDPSVSGYALQAANLLGQVAPVVATGAVTRGRVIPSAAVAASLGGGAAGAQEEQRIEQMPQAELDKLQGYRDLIAGGMNPADARKALAERTGSRAALTTAPISALSAFTEALPVAGVGQKTLSKLVGKSRLTRAGAGALLDAGAEGVQEAAEQVAQTAGANTATGENRSLGTDTFQNAVLGALGGTVPGAIGGLAHGVEGEEVAAPEAETAAAPQAVQAQAEAGAPEAVEQATPTVVGEQPAFTPSVTDAGTVEVAPGVEVDEHDGALQKALVEGAAEGSLDQPATAQLSDGSTMDAETGELLTPPPEAPGPSETGAPAPQPQAPSGSGTNVPFMITAAQRRELTARGYDRRSIAQMTPDEAQAILAQPAPAAPEAPTAATPADLDAAVAQHYAQHGVIDAKATGMLARRLGVSRQDVTDAKRRVAGSARTTSTEPTASAEPQVQSNLDLTPTPETGNAEEPTQTARPEATQITPEESGTPEGNEPPELAGGTDTGNAPVANVEAGERGERENGADTGHAPVADSQAGTGNAAAVSGSVSTGADEHGAVPAEEAEVKATRSSNAAGTGPSPFVQNLMDLGGITRDQAETAYTELKKAGAITRKAGQPESVKHGAFLDRDVIRRAAGIEDEAASAPAPAPEAAPSTETKAKAAPVKWFGSREKAEGHIAKKKLAGTHEVVQNGRRFEVRPKAGADGAETGQAKAANLKVVDNSDANPGEHIVRDESRTLARFRLSKSGDKALGVKHFSASRAVRDSTDKAIARFVAERKGETGTDAPAPQAEAKAQPTITEQIKRAKKRLLQARRQGTDTAPIEAEISRLRSRAFDDEAPAADRNDKAPTPADGIERGAIGGKYKSGQKLKTSSGRTTTPFPLVSTGTDRKTNATIKRVHKWLMQNALDEARARGDDFNARQFEANLEKPSQADRDSAEEYLFGEQPNVVPRITRPLTDDNTESRSATAPEHEATGVDDRELGEIVQEFNEAREKDQKDDQEHHLFDSPDKGEITRLAQKTRVYVKDHGWLTPAEAKEKIAEWREHAENQYDDPAIRSANQKKIVLSLFDLSGEWSKPWEEAGYQVFRFDIQDESTYTDPETGEEKKVGDVHNMSVEFFSDLFGSFDGLDVHAILAACPCTDFAVSGARHFAAKDADGRTVASVKLVHKTLAAIEYFRPAVWAIENPVGRIEKLGGLPPWRLSFDPNDIGDPYTKKTLLWGRFNSDLPVAPVEPTEGSKMHRLYGGRSMATKNARSVTPEGFSYAFFMANNAHDHPALAVANKYDRLDGGLIQRAMNAGVTPEQIDDAVEDAYYMDGDDAAAEKAIRDLIPNGPTSKRGSGNASEVRGDQGQSGQEGRPAQESENAGGENLQRNEEARSAGTQSETKGQQGVQDADEQVAGGRKPVTVTKAGEGAHAIVIEPGAAAPEPSKTKPTPAANTIFTEDAAEKARALLKKKLGQLNTGIDPEILQAGITLAGYHIEKGARTFAAYAKAMIADLGEGVRPYLKSWYMGVKYDPRASQFEGMDSAATVESADVEEITKEATNEPASTDSNDAEALGEVPARENQAPESAENVGGGNTERRPGRAKRNRKPDGEGVSGARSRGSRASKTRSTDAGSRGGNPRPGEARVGGDGPGVSPEPAGVTPPATTIPARDFKITDEVELGKGGEVTKFNDNLAAIRIVKALEAENRRATADEQAKLARYVGWGGLANAFQRPNGTYANGWEDRAKQVESLLTPNELAAARRSTRNAHYTSPTVVRGLWSAMERLGFAGGTVLEPAMGTGNFIGLRPDSLRGAQFVGVELDPLTARIAGALYPSETVLNSGLQKVALPDDAFDAVIQNPPFGQESLNFQYKPELNGLSIHNQFALASLDAVKPGGTMGMVVSRYLMDAKDATTRERLADRAELVGAIRLPDSAFKENARTEVVTDMLLFRKFTEAEAAARQAEIAEAAKNKQSKPFPEWVNTADVADPLGGDKITVNGYFAARPSMILGVLERSGSMAHGNDVTVRGVGDLQSAIDKAVSTLPKDVARTTPDVIAASKVRYQGMANSLRLALSGAEAGEIRFTNDGKLEQVIERETPTGDHELTVRELSPASPWSSSLYMNADGQWFSLTEKLDDKGNKVKKMVDGRKTNFNVYTRKVYKTDAEVPERQRLGAAGFKRLTEMAKLRDLLKDQLTLEAEDAPESQLTENRTKLREAYETFQKANGYVNERKNASLVLEMPDGALVLALEHGFRAGTKTSKASAKPAPILSERVVEPYEPPSKADSAADALSITLAESGRVDVDRVAALLGTDREGAVEALTGGDHPLAFSDPETKELSARNEYLTGNVRRKLAAAVDAHLAANVAALEAVQPEPWGAENVTMRVGGNWVPSDVYQDFAEHLMGGKAHVFYSPLTNTYQVSVKGGKTNADYSTERASTETLLSDLLNSKSTVIRRRVDEKRTVVDEEATTLATQARQAIEREFEDWAFADRDRRNRLVDLFNDKFNVRVARQYDGSHLSLPGKVPDTVIRMRRHQNNAIWRGISQRFMLVDHAVGAGKTFTAIARAMERRRMGLARKPMIAVPNHLVEQWAADVYRLYPGAKVLAAGSKDFTKTRRRRLFAKIATGDWDVVIVPHSSFGFIGISPETETRYLEAEIDRATEAIAEAEEDAQENATGGFGKPIGVKEAERLKEKLEARMSKLQSATRDKLLTFEQMGVDDLTVDEAHEFKNLFYSSRLTGVRGMGNKEGSRKAFDLYNKVRVLRESPTGAVTFLTGTPISNSAVEMYTMMRYLAADELRDMGLENFDAWRSQFVTAEPAFEPTETGSLKEVTRLGRSWSNMRSLMELYSSFTDSVTNQDIEKAYSEDHGGKRFPIPDVAGGGRQSIVIQPTKAQVTLLNEIIAGFNALPSERNPKERNKKRLRLMDRARKVSVDVRAAGGEAIDNEAGGKLQVIADNVASLYRKWDADKGTQLIFLDRSVPKSKGDKAIITAYDKLKKQADEALAKGEDAKYMQLQEKLEKYDANEIAELRAAQNGGWNAYQQIKDNLVERGIPADQIRFVQEANNDAQKKALFDAVNAGEVRVLIGSTPRMGAGTNVQERLVALHHADVTWKPSDIEQREGRIIRQGNKLLEKYGADNFEVVINAYATERTIDAKMWDLNSHKLKTINAIRKYDGEFNMDFEDEDAVGMAEMAALASGDPLLMERVKLTSEIDKLELLERAQKRRRWGLQRRLDDAKSDLEKGPARLAHYQGIAGTLAGHLQQVRQDQAARAVSVEGEQYATIPDAQRAVLAAIESQKAGDKNAKFSVEVGGKRHTTKADAEEAVKAVMGDVDAFAGKVDGKTFVQRKDMSNAIGEKIGDASAIDGKKVGEMYGLPLVADVEMSDMGRVATLTLTDTNGKTLLSAEGKPKQTKGAFSGQEIRPMVNELSRGVVGNYAKERAANLERTMREAKSSIPEIEEQLAKPPQGLEELQTKRDRLAEVVQELQAKDGGEQNKPEFSKAETAPSRSVSPAALERMVSATTAKWKNAPVVVRVVKTASELPSFIRNAKGFDGNVEAAHANGAVYLVADRLASIERAQRVLAHEVIGHYTVEQMLGPQGFAQVRDQIVKLRDAGKMPELFAELERRYGKLDDTELASEAMAVMAEKGMRNTIMGRLMAAVRKFLRGLGFNVQFSEGDLRQIITDAGRYAEGRGAKPGKARVAVVNGVSFGVKPYGEPTGITFEPFVNNASGESAASIEAINRLRDEQANGQLRVLIDRDGSVRPLLGVDAVDTFARKGQVIAQRGVGSDEWTPISTDPGMNRSTAQGIIARVQSRLDTTISELNGSGEWDVNEDELPGIAWSKRPPEDVMADLERAAKFHVTDIVQVMRDKREDWRPGWLGMLTLRQLAEVTEKYLPRIRKYADEVQAMETRRNILTDEAFGQADKWATWARKHRDENKTMVGVMHDATLAGVDPAEKFVPGVVTLASGQAVPMTPDAVKAALSDLKKQVKGAPNDAIKRVLRADAARIEEAYNVEASRAEAFPALKRRFDALPEEAKTIYREVRDSYAARSEAMQDALLARIGALELPQEERRALADQVRANFESARVQGPYFPLARFGDYWVSAEKDGVKEFRMMENRAQQRRVLEAYKAKGWSTAAGAKIDMARAVDGASANFMAQVTQTMADNGVPSEVADEVYQLYLRTLPDLSVRKQFIHRKGTPGYDQDALRAFAAHMGHGAYQLARLEHSHKMEGLISDMRKDAMAFEQEGDLDAVKAARAITEVNKRHEWVMSPKDAGWVQKITAANFIYYLGTTPAAAIVNLTQGFITTFPALAAKHGWVKAMTEIVKGLRQSIRTLGHVEKVLTGDELRAHKELSAMGAIDKTRAHDLAGMGDGSILSYNPAWRNTMKVTSELFHRSEVFNREAAGLASYRLARQSGQSHDEAVKYAADTIFDTHFDYSNANRARFMQSNTAKVIFAFRQYSQHMLYYIWRNFYQSVRGATKQEKAEARRKLVGTLGMTALFSGTLGLPMMTLAFGVANAFHHMFGDDDEPWDAETEFRNFLVEMFGPELGKIAQTGVANALTGMDIASRTKLDQMWFRAPDRELEGREQYDFWLEQLAGPVGGMFANGFRAAQLWGEGHFERGVETVMPKFIKDGLKSMRYATQGVNTLRGDPLVKDVTPFELLMQAAGFSPAKVNAQYTANNALKNYEKALTGRRRALMDAYAMAVRMRDKDAIRSVTAKINHFNQENPEIGITANSIRRSLMARERYSERTVNGMALNPRLAAKVKARVRFAEEGGE